MKLYEVTNKKDRPRAMTVLAVGKEIFIASSIKHSANCIQVSRDKGFLDS
jgi:hypothetical protein